MPKSSSSLQITWITSQKTSKTKTSTFLPNSADPQTSTPFAASLSPKRKLTQKKTPTGATNE